MIGVMTASCPKFWLGQELGSFWGMKAAPYGSSSLFFKANIGFSPGYGGGFDP